MTKDRQETTKKDTQNDQKETQQSKIDTKLKIEQKEMKT